MNVFLLPTNVKTIREAIMKSIIFFDLFDFPLTFEEISKYVLGMRVDEQHIRMYLKDSKMLSEKNGFYFVRGREHIADLRQSNAKCAIKLWNKVFRYSWVFKMVPFIKMVAVCNSLSYMDVNKKSDIDLFVTTDKNRLFTARFLLSAILYLLGVKRHDHKVAGRFCLSFFVTENSLDMEQVALKPYDIYLAFWAMSLTPVFGEKTYNEFVEKNSWTKRYFPDGIIPNTSVIHKSGFIARAVKRFLTRVLSGKLGGKLEGYLSRALIKRAESKAEKLPDRRGTIISSNIMKFHDNDIREYIREAWEKKTKLFS
ncbi:MAG: hypothetical protein WCT36_01930 [Candidatus Gracilibacteria bacterium]|jgi:hypothetical protein